MEGALKRRISMGVGRSARGQYSRSGEGAVVVWGWRERHEVEWTGLLRGASEREQGKGMMNVSDTDFRNEIWADGSGVY